MNEQIINGITWTRCCRNYLVPLFLALIPLELVAHEFWIEASDYSPESGSVVSLTARVGQGFVGEEIPNIEAFYSDYSVLTSSGRTTVLGSLATKPPAYINITSPGSYIVGQRTKRNFVELEPEKFLKYLNKHGLEFIFPKLKARHLSYKLAKEDYSRCVKTIVQTDDSIQDVSSASKVLSQAFGYTLELIPLSNPQLLTPGDKFKVRLLYEGKALAGAKITSVNKDYAGQTREARTDSEGIAEIPVNQAGVWMMNAVHMIEAKRDEVDWESFWASLTFEIGA